MSKSYTETYRNLFHGTTLESALDIENSKNFILSEDGWCGSGIYFYDNKTKAMWAAQRKCVEQSKKDFKKHCKACICAEIVELNKSFIFDLRAQKDLINFQNFADELLKGQGFSIQELDDNEKIKMTRTMLIAFYSDQNNIKLVVGNFRQTSDGSKRDLYAYAEKWNLVFGVETIYCVKDVSILKNIRRYSHEQIV